MKNIKQTLLAAVATTMLATQADAKIWRVNNNGYSADFTQILAANNDPNVLAGDTLHLEGSNVVYNSVTLTKTLVIIGPGYNHSSNVKTSSNNLEAICGTITINNSAPGTQIIGITSEYGGMYGVAIYANNVVVKRCKFPNSIDINKYLSNIIISQNYFYNASSSSNTNSVISWGWISDFPTNLVFNNNILQSRLLRITGFSTPFFIFQSVNNNVFDVPAITGSPSLEFYTAEFRNNILTTSTATVKINGTTNFTTTPSAIVSHNIGTSSVAHFGTSNNNLVIANLATNLWDATYAASPDGKYQLQANSQGSGNGFGNIDRGAFGGVPTNRYQLSGLASIPVVYEVSTQGVATPSQGLPITIKARSIQ